MNKRNKIAVIAQEGASNPTPLIRGLRDSLEELLGEQVDGLIAGRLPSTDTILNDPALRLIIHQLAHLFKVGEYQLDMTEYARLCEQVSMTKRRPDPADTPTEEGTQP